MFVETENVSTQMHVTKLGSMLLQSLVWHVPRGSHCRGLLHLPLAKILKKPCMHKHTHNKTIRRVGWENMHSFVSTYSNK